MLKSTTRKTVHAAGGVLWRHSGDEIEVALIHRPRYDDWSLPKGKVERGETLVSAAVREIAEETGHEARLGRYLADISYDLPNARKHVRYWAAESIGGDFAVNHEVDALRWVPADRAGRLLSYRPDRRVMAEFTRLPNGVDTMLLVRHAKAGQRSRYVGDDRLRPLDAEGRAQADALVPLLVAFGVDRLSSAPRLRCEQTLEPMAALLDSGIVIEPDLSEEAYRGDPAAAHDRIRELALEHRNGLRGDEGVRAVCSQGKVIPPLMRWWADHDDLKLPKSRNRKASVWVITTYRGRLVAADHIDSPLPRHEKRGSPDAEQIAG
ncbi:NUDIX hydrolase [Gordonia sinesedis]